jgi:hypothetical protein
VWHEDLGVEGDLVEELDAEGLQQGGGLFGARARRHESAATQEARVYGWAAVVKGGKGVARDVDQRVLVRGGREDGTGAEEGELRLIERGLG